MMWQWCTSLSTAATVIDPLGKMWSFPDFVDRSQGFT